MGSSPNATGANTAVIPPPPPGFTLDTQASASIPPPPDGFTLDSAEEPATFTERAIGIKHPIDSLRDAYDTLTHAGALAKVAGGAENLGSALKASSETPIPVPSTAGGLAEGPALLARAANFTINQGKMLYENAIQDIKDKNIPATAGDLIALALAAIPFTKGASAGIEAVRAGEGTLSAASEAMKATAGAMIGLKPEGARPEFPTNIRGVNVPQTATEAGVIQGQAAKNLEAITSALPGGSGLRKVQEAQEAAAEEVLGRLSQSSQRGGLTAAQNFIDLGERTKALADPHFEAIRNLESIPASTVKKVTEDFAENSSDLLKGESKGAASKVLLSGSPAVRSSAVLSGTSPSLAAALTGSKEAAISGDDLLNLRRTVSELASKFSDDPRGFEIRKFRDSLDDAIETDLAKVPNGAKLAENYETARGLWYKAEVQQQFGKALMKSIISQPALAERNLPSAETLNTIVNQLDNQKVRYGPLKGKTALQAAFPYPGDVEALKQLGLMMDRSTMSGGMAARFGILGMMRGTGGLAVGAPTGIITNAAMAAVARITSGILAYPGGARALLLLAKTPPTAARFTGVLARAKNYVDAEQMN